MQNTRVYNRYAKALLETAIEMNCEERVFTDMQRILLSIMLNREFRRFLHNPTISVHHKTTIISEMFETSVDKLTFNFLVLILKKRRELNLEEIATAYIRKHREYKGIEIARLLTPTEMDDDFKNRIIAMLEKQTGKTIELINIEVPELLGGFAIQIEDLLFDYSVESRIRQLQQQFKKNVYRTKL